MFKILNLMALVRGSCSGTNSKCTGLWIMLLNKQMWMVILLLFPVAIHGSGWEMVQWKLTFERWLLSRPPSAENALRNEWKMRERWNEWLFGIHFKLSKTCDCPAGAAGSWGGCMWKLLLWRDKLNLSAWETFGAQHSQTGVTMSLIVMVGALFEAVGDVSVPFWGLQGQVLLSNIIQMYSQQNHSRFSFLPQRAGACGVVLGITCFDGSSW